MKNKKLLGNAILMFTAAIWGMGFAWQRLGMEDIGPVTFTAAREIISAVFIGIVAVIINGIARKKERIRSGPFYSDSRDRSARERRGATIRGGICCGVFLVSATLFQQWGIVYTTAGKAGFITAMYMLFVPIVGFVLFKMRHSWTVWLAVALGVVGMYFLCMNEVLYLTKGDALMLVCALLYSGHILCCDHFVEKAEPISMSAIQFVTASVISLVLAFILEVPQASQIRTAILPILYCGFVSGGMGYTLQIVGQKFADPTPASLIMSLEAVFAVLGGVLMLGERMTLREGAGCIIMFVAIILVQIDRKGDQEALDPTSIPRQE
ncbi:MAG: DMT family transporter [Lachnospiraceae bacterium]|nr:DMT family transporter [Lachnospiraceae bacterium]